MKKAIIVTSCIDTDKNAPIFLKTYGRSAFSDEERLRHTVFTVTSLDHVVDEDTRIYLLDASEDNEKYRDFFLYQKNLIYVPVKKLLPEAYKIARNHYQKTHCEATLLLSFLENFKDELKPYDYIIKLSGRYFVDSNFSLDLFNEANINKFFFKKPLTFEWEDHWNFEMVDRRAIQGDNYLYWYSSVLYGWGKGAHEKMMDMYRKIHDYTKPGAENQIYDFETLFYYLTVEHRQDVIETDWIVFGWGGTTGQFFRY